LHPTQPYTEAAEIEFDSMRRAILHRFPEPAGSPEGASAGRWAGGCSDNAQLNEAARAADAPRARRQSAAAGEWD
jgi:hypothetical protein